MNLIKFITESGLVPLQKGQDSFVPIYRIYFDMLRGDLYACFVLGEILRLQNSPQAQENDGWVVLTYQTIKAKYYMSKHLWDKAVEALKPIGLNCQLKPHPRYPGARAGVWHYRFDEAALMTAVAAHVAKKTAHAEGIQGAPLKNFDPPSSKILTTPPQNFSPILDINILDQDLYQTCPEDISDAGDGGKESQLLEEPGRDINLTTKTNSVENKPEKVPPPSRRPRASGNRANGDRASGDRASGNRASGNRANDVNHSSGYKQVFTAVKTHVFGIKDSVTGLPTKRVGLIASYLWGSNKAMQAPRPEGESDAERAINLCSDLENFVLWWRHVYPQASLPLDLGKFAHHWLKFWSHHSQVYQSSNTQQADSTPLDEEAIHADVKGSVLRAFFGDD